MTVAICAILHNPNKKYLAEWLDHHRRMGVDFFVLWENDCTDPLEGAPDIILRKCTGWDRGRVQMDAYQQTAQAMIDGNLRWADRIVFIDEDEFLICQGDDLKTFLADKNESLVVSWQMMGSNGISGADPRPQMEKFTSGTGEDFHLNTHVKTIASPKAAATHWPNPHVTTAGAADVDGNAMSDLSGRMPRAIHRGLWVRHFFTRSKGEFEAKMLRGHGRGRRQPLTWGHFEEVENACRPI